MSSFGRLSLRFRRRPQNLHLKRVARKNVLEAIVTSIPIMAQTIGGKLGALQNTLSTFERTSRPSGRCYRISTSDNSVYGYFIGRTLAAKTEDFGIARSIRARVATPSSPFLPPQKKNTKKAQVHSYFLTA